MGDPLFPYAPPSRTAGATALVLVAVGLLWMGEQEVDYARAAIETVVPREEPYRILNLRSGYGAVCGWVRIRDTDLRYSVGAGGTIIEPSASAWEAHAPRLLNTWTICHRERSRNALLGHVSIMIVLAISGSGRGTG